MAFPLPYVPKSSYRHARSSAGKELNALAFGADRDGGKRRHAACDLLVPPGTRVRAIEGGKVVEGPTLFYSGTYYLVVQHDSGIVVRYGEIAEQVPDGIQVDSRVVEGQVIATVGRLNSGHSMLHFELYDGRLGRAQLTVRSSKNGFQRRDDLIDPTALLDRLAAADKTLDKGQA